MDRSAACPRATSRASIAVSAIAFWRSSASTRFRCRERSFSRRAMKPTTFVLEVIVVERRFFVLVD